MDKKNVPQDKGVVEQLSLVFYAVDESGKYVKEQSAGWEPVTVAHDQAFEAMEERLALVGERVKKGELSPIAYYMEKCLMDVKMLSRYTGISRWRVKRHLDPKVFRRLPPSLLERYAKVFGISSRQLTTGAEDG